MEGQRDGRASPLPLHTKHLLHTLTLVTVPGTLGLDSGVTYTVWLTLAPDHRKASSILAVDSRISVRVTGPRTVRTTFVRDWPSGKVRSTCQSLSSLSEPSA